MPAPAERVARPASYRALEYQRISPALRHCRLVTRGKLGSKFANAFDALIRMLRVCSSTIRCATPLWLRVTSDRSSTTGLPAKNSAEQSTDLSNSLSLWLIGHSGVARTRYAREGAQTGARRRTRVLKFDQPHIPSCRMVTTGLTLASFRGRLRGWQIRQQDGVEAAQAERRRHRQQAGARARASSGKMRALCCAG